MCVVCQVKRNVLDVTHQVSQYQNIIAELKDEIGRLKTKITVQVTGTTFQRHERRPEVTERSFPRLLKPCYDFAVAIGY